MADVVPVDAPEFSTEAFDLHAAASEFYDHFPAFQGRVSFVDVTTGAIINSDPARVEEMARYFATPEGHDELAPIIQRCNKFKCPYTQFTNTGDCVVFMYTQEDAQSYFGDAVSRAREMQFTFDHETGHIVVPEGSSDDRLKAENAADAFALLRDLQRGGDNVLARAALMFRTTYALFSRNGIINFSAPMIENFIGERGKLAQEDLNPEKMVSLAGQFADRDTMEAARIENFKSSIEKLHGQPSLAALTDVTLQTPLPDTFKWTSTVLKAALAGHIYLPGTTTEAFNEAARDVPPRLKEREEEFSRPPAAKYRAAAMAAAPA